MKHGCIFLLLLALLAPGAFAQDRAAHAADALQDAAPAGDDAPAEPPQKIRFQFDGVPYTDVVRRFAEMAGKPLIGDLNIAGELTFFDAEPYAYDEALDTLNLLLAQQGYTLLETGRFLRLVAHSELPQMPLPILKGSDDAEDIRPGQLVTMVVPVKFIEAEAAAKAVVPMISTFGRITPMVNGKGIVITDTKANIARVRRLLLVMDNQELAEQQLRTIQLKHASAKDAAVVVRQLVGPVRGRRGESEEGVTATPDERTNLLILRGPADKVAIAESIIARLDIEQGDETVGSEDLRIFELKGAKATELAATLAQVVPGAAANEKGGGDVKLVPEQRTNRLLVSAPIDRMPGIEKLISALDKQSVETEGVRLFRLKFADAKQLAGIIAATGKRTDAKGRPVASVNVSADPRSNTLVISGNAADIDAAAKLVAQLDSETATTEAREIHVVQLKAGDAATLAGSIAKLFKQSGGDAGSLIVEADKSTNSLIIAAAPGDWPTVQKVLDELKTSAIPMTTPTTRLIPLKHADPAELAKSLAAVFKVANTPVPGKPAPVPVTIVPSDRSRSLLVSAADDDHQRIAELIKAMDVEGDEGVDGIYMVQLKSANAEALAGTIKSMLPPRVVKRGDISIAPEPSTNAVLVRGPEAERAMIESLIARLDEQTTAEARSTRMVQIKHASAKAVAATLSQLYPATENKTDARGRATPVPVPESQRVTIAAGPSDKVLIIDAPQSTGEQIATMAQSLDQEQEQFASLQVRTYELKTGQAAPLAASLTKLFTPDKAAAANEPAPRFQADVKTNQLMVAATASQFTEIDAVIKNVEATATTSSQTRTFTLAHARADDVAAVLKSMLTQVAGKPDAVRLDVRVAAMNATNTVVVQGTADDLAIAEQLVKTFDVKEASTQTVIQTVQLKNADAATMADALTAILAAKAPARDPRQPQAAVDEAVMVTAEVNANALLVRGPANEVKPVVEMVQKLDVESTSSNTQMRIYKLSNSDAATLAPTLEKLFKDIIKQQSATTRGKPAPPFAISADPRTNALVVSTTQGHFSLIEQLLENLDKADDRPMRDVRYVWLQNADAFDVASKLNAMYTDRKGPDKPVIEADDFTNSVTIIAKAEDLDAIDPLIEKLDAAARDNSVQVKVLRMQGVRASRMAEVLQTIYPQVSGGKVIVTDTIKKGEKRNEADVPEPAPGNTTDDADKRGDAAEQGDASAEHPTPQLADADEAVETQGPVTIAVDDSSNALIVAATRQQLEQIESLINELQAEAAAESDIRIFRIQAGDPATIADTIDELFNADKRARIRQAQKRQRDRNNRNNEEQQDPLPTIDVNAIADTRTRSVIVRAKSSDMELIDALISKLDLVATVVSEVRVFPLKNTDAKEVADNLKELLSMAASGQRGGGQGQDERAAMTRRLLELKKEDGVTQVDTTSLISVTANAKTNSVVIAAPTDAMAIVAGIIQELDQSAALSQVPSVRMYPMQHADVATAAKALSEVFPQRKDARGAEVPIKVTSDQRGKLIIVSALVDQHKLIADILTDLDAAQADDETLLRVYRIGYAEAAAVASALEGTMVDAKRGSESSLRIRADESSNSVVVRGTAADHEQIVKLIDEIDVAPADQYPVQLITLRHADAEKVAEVLIKVFAPGQKKESQPRPWWAAPAEDDQQRQQIVIEADSDAKVLMVRADDETFKKVKALAQQLDASSAFGDATRTVIPLKHAKAENVAPALMQAFAPQRGQRVSLDDLVTVTAEAKSNTLIVTANAENLEKVKALLEKIDTDDAEGVRTEFVLLKNARATDLQRVLEQALPRPRDQWGRAQPPETSVAADAGSNAVILNGPTDQVDKLMRMAMQLDQASVENDTGVFIIPLEKGDASTIAGMVRDMYQQQRRANQRGGAGIDPLAVTADERANAIVLATTKKMHDSVLEWVKQVETMKPKRGASRIILLEHANPEEVQKAIDELFGDATPRRTPRADGDGVAHAQPRGRGSGGAIGGGVASSPVELSVLPGQKALIFNGSDEDYAAVLKLVQALDAEAAKRKPTLKVFQIKHASNTRIATALQQMYANLDDEKVTVTALQNTDTVVVAAGETRLAEVEHLIGQLDKEETGGTLEFRIYTLKHAEPTKLLPVLRPMLDQLQAIRPGEPINVQADERTKSIIVTARSTVFDQIGKIIESLDEAPAYAEAEVLIIPLKRADATRLAEVLNNMLKPTEGGAVTAEARALQEQIRRLRVKTKDGRKLPELDLTKPIKVDADPVAKNDEGSNRLIISSTADNLKAMAAIVDVLDRVPVAEGVVVRVKPLEHADASTVAATLQSVFEQGKRLAGDDEDKEPETVSGKALVHPLNIAADVRTNSLIMSGLEESVALAEAMLKQLDSKVPIELRDIRIIPLANAEAATLATTLQRMMDARVQRQQSLGVKDADALRVIVVPDARSNSLIVGGSKDSFALVESIAGKLDGASPALGGQIQLIALDNANASTIAATLQNMFNQRYQAATADDVRRQRPIILADVRSNALLVAANNDDSKILEGLLEKLDVKLKDASVQLVVLPLKHNDAAIVGSTIRTLFQARLQSMTPPGQAPNPQDRVDVATDNLSNALIISASKENLELINGLLGKVDVAPPVESGVVKMFTLDNADAARIGSLLQNLVSQGLYKPGAAAAAGNAVRQAQETVSITTDVRTNTVIVSASKENFAIIEQIIKRIDAEKDFAALGDVKLYTLKNADAVRLAPTLQQFFNSKRQAEIQAGDSGESLAVNIVADSRTNTILVTGSAESFKLVEGMIAKLDGETPEELHQFRIFELRNATATIVQPTLERLFQNRPTRQGQTNEPVTVVADARGNALIVGAVKEDMELAEQLIKKLEAVPDTDASHVKIFPLANANAADVAETIRNVFADEEELITISADERMNAIVVSGGENDVKRVEAVITQLDGGTTRADVTEIKVFNLTNADAGELAQILTDTLTRKPDPVAGESDLRQPLLQFITRSQDGKDLIATALQRGILFTPDRRTNSIVVTAPVENMPLIKQIVDAMDDAAPRMAKIKVFPLENADARTMADVLTELFRLRDVGDTSRRSVSYTLVSHEKVPGGEDDDGETEVTLGTDAQYALTVTVDVRTNSLLLGGTEHYVKLAEDIINELDSSPAQERMTKVYRLKNAQATDIQTALRSFLDQERQRLVQALGEEGMGAAQRLLEHEVAVVAEGSSNTLLLSASPRYFETVAAMIDELDEPAPQVLIQVLLAEVTLDEGKELGVEWRVQKSAGEFDIDSMADFGVQAAIASFGGFSTAVTSDDFQLFLRALKSDGRLEVLSRPQIMATDNQPATINVGQRVPLITNSRVTDEGTTINSITYEDVGIILQVTPRITGDGFVKMDVRPEISSLSDSDIDISENVAATIINRNFAETTVSVKDGQTIVIGGLITANDNIRFRKVPLLGDIPIVGAAFRSETVSRQRRELLVILTPYIMRDNRDIDRTTRNQVGKNGILNQLIDDDEVESELFKRLQNRYDEEGKLDPRRENNAIKPPGDAIREEEPAAPKRQPQPESNVREITE